MKKQKAPYFKERSFGLSVGGVMMAIAAYATWRHRTNLAVWFGAIGATLFILGYLQPRLLKYPSMVWWKFAMILGYVNARIILSIAFLIVLTPIGLVWRLTGHDPLARRRANWPGWSPAPERFRHPEHFNRMY